MNKVIKEFHIAESKLITWLFVKPTDQRQYLYYSSGHPEYTKLPIINKH